MNSLSTSLRAAAALAIFLLAGLGILFVLDVIPREQLTDISIKALAVVAILAASGFLLGLLMKTRASE